ncbi:winged helix-turn-helix domain-containing protein [Paraburkholderia dipogonis]|uniref:ATP-binding protein n=1 Tax=Paraburkholderia dipogonis TaxID=1211383 RepID=UPI0035E74307
MIRIGPLQVDLASRELFLDGQPVRIGSRAFDILAVLIGANGALVSKSAMLEQVWPDTIVEENNLQVHMSALRKVLGESRNLIQTVSGRGYRLASRDAPAKQAGKPARDSAPDAAEDSACLRGIPNNLPANISSLIGRDQAISDIARALASTRHVTLVGSGGIGKTRMAIEIARSLLAHFPDGVYLVPLACTVDANSVLAMFAHSVGVSAASGPLTLAHISKELSERRVLFVLDNCEHVLGPAAELAEALLNASPAMRILATSREPLRVMDEHLYWVASLDVPARDDESQQVLQRSAVQLFFCHGPARSTRVFFVRRQKHPFDRHRMPPPRRHSVGDRTGGGACRDPRHRDARRSSRRPFQHADWRQSHCIAAPPDLEGDARLEPRIARRRGAHDAAAARCFSSTVFTIDSAIALVSDEGLRESAVIAALSGLVEKSLVVMQAERGKARYRLLETTRAYAMQKLDDNGERRAVTLTHARYFANLLERDPSSDASNAAREANAAGAERHGWHLRMREQLDDLRAALGWALSPKGDAALGETLAVKFVSLLYELSLVDECCVWARRALDAMNATYQGSRSPRHLRVRMQLLAALAAALVYVNGPNREALGVWAEVLAIAIALGDQTFEARALWGMWNASQSSGEARNALAFAQRFASLAAETGDTANGILADRLLGIAAHYAGDQHQARASLDRFLQHAGRLQHRLPLGQSIDQGVVGRATFARVLGLQGARDQALMIAEACVAQACRQGQAIVTCYVLVEAEIPLALLAGQRKRAAQAIALLRDVSARGGLRVAHACCRCFDEYLHSLDDTSAQRVHSFRAALDDLDALDYAAPRAMLAAQYALALGRAGQHEEGVAAVVDALARSDETGDQWYAAELRRVHAELLLMEYGSGQSPFGDAATHAQASLIAAVEESSARDCCTLHLRAATSLGRLWHAQGRSAEAVHLLKSACAGLTEGRDWDDFKAAKELLRVANEACTLAGISAGIDLRMETNAEANAASFRRPAAG